MISTGTIGGPLLKYRKTKIMTLTDRILQWRKRRAIKRRDHVTYFRLVSIIAKREAAKIVNEKLKK